MTARVKISQNVDILAKVYLVHLKVKTMSNLHVATCSAFTGQNESIVLTGNLSCIVEGGKNDSHTQSKMPLCVGSTVQTVS